MADIRLTPDLKTAGGEVCDILYNGEFVGTLTLVYRESDRMKGSIHLEEQSIAEESKQDVYDGVQVYVQNLVDALNITECEVTASCSDYDFVIATDHAIRPVSEQSELAERVYENFQDQIEYEWVDDDAPLSMIDEEEAADQSQWTLLQQHKQDKGYELVIVGESRNHVEYQIYDREADLVAEASLRVYGPEVIGDITWSFDPFEEEMDLVTELIVDDFNEEDTDSFVFHMQYNGETVDTIELTHLDVLDLSDEMEADEEFDVLPNRDDYSIVLARDDGDTLTYEIYEQSNGSLPIGTATIDVSSRQLTGFIDFREPGSPDDRELIATLLLDELDKENEYETFNVSMLYRNKLIDEILFETEQLH
ncbi:hypothetical protein [Paenibacillus ferrarius]|uniref:hypothetical protein n=1 Tax=Paenibacillus ferrarius TaxID=1469647 RepID=UPI003D2C2A06